MDRCEACGETRPINSVMRRWRIITPSGPPPAMTEEHRLCHECHVWITGLMDDVRGHRLGAPSIVGSPSHADRALVFADQCHLCRELLDPRASIVDCRRVKDDALAWGGFILCAACDIWLANLAIDGRSVRHRAERAIDGPYGAWLHPDLSRLVVTLAVADPSARETVRSTCSRMGIEVVTDLPHLPADAAVLFFEPHEREAYPAWAWDSPVPWRGRVAMAQLSTRQPLRRAIAAGASDWLTIPVTPQQITGALQRAFRVWSQPIRIDRDSGLPVAYPDAEDRPSLSVHQDPGADLHEVVWLLRRYTRGYDDLAVTEDGRILLFPRTSPANVPLVAERLNRLLLGRCEVRTRDRYEAIRPTLDAVG